MSKRKKGSQPKQLEKDDQGNVPPGTSTQGDQSTKKIRIQTSNVHDEFVQTKYVENDVEKTRSKCKHCEKVYEHKLCSELKRHLKSCHPHVYKKVELRDIKEKEDRVDGVPRSRDDEIQEAYNDWLMASGQPMSISDHPLFKKFVEVLDPEAKIPGKAGQLTYSFQKFLKMEQKMKDILADSTFVTLTMDMWSNKSCRESFLGVTVHAWDEGSKKRRNFRLCIRTFSERHTAPNIIIRILKVLEEFQIRGKVRFISTDNGSNIRRYYDVAFVISI